MKASEIVAQIKESNPKLLGQLPDAKATKLVSLILSQTAQQINNTEQGVVKVAGLGVFRVKQREVEKDGVKSTVKKVSFKAAPAKVKKAD